VHLLGHVWLTLQLCGLKISYLYCFIDVPTPLIKGYDLITFTFLVVDVDNHRRAVAQPCVNGDRLSKRKMAKFDPAQIQNPSTDRHKIWNRWLRPRSDPLCKISCKSVYWGLLGKWVKYNENFSSIYIYLFCWPTYRSDRQADFHARWLGQRGLTQGSNFFGNRNSKLISNPRKIPRKSKIWPKKRLENCWPKTLLYKNFTYKRPLIVIVVS